MPKPTATPLSFARPYAPSSPSCFARSSDSPSDLSPTRCSPPDSAADLLAAHCPLLATASAS
jgi:hypothetical protein